jgi:uncharacterized protein YndB with AHSA1/START domain
MAGTDAGPLAPQRGQVGFELTITRSFAAPRGLVFKAWTRPEMLVRWLGPRGFMAREISQDVRPGGAWRACLRPDDGGDDLWQGGVYHEVVEPERLAFTFAWDGNDGCAGRETLVTITLDEDGPRTLMTFRQKMFETVQRRDGHFEGWSSSFGRLAEFLADRAAEQQSGEHER